MTSILKHGLFPLMCVNKVFNLLKASNIVLILNNKHNYCFESILGDRCTVRIYFLIFTHPKYSYSNLNIFVSRYCSHKLIYICSSSFALSLNFKWIHSSITLGLQVWVWASDWIVVVLPCSEELLRSDVRWQVSANTLQYYAGSIRILFAY